MASFKLNEIRVLQFIKINFNSMNKYNLNQGYSKR